MNRRRVLQFGGASLLTGIVDARPARASAASLTKRDAAFLDDLIRRGCLYFMEQASPDNGQVLDRAGAGNTTGARDPRRIASIAATGFGLSALCIAHRYGYLSQGAVRERVLRTLRFHAEKLPQHHGFYWHFSDVETGEPLHDIELSTIDTALLLCGVLTARAYFAHDDEIARHATAIYNRVDWPWFLNGGSAFSMGWHAKSGFLASTWNHYCEMMMLPLLAMGSPTHALGPEIWNSFTRPHTVFERYDYIGGPDPLFVHQYSHAWFDFRNRRDRYANYFQNSVLATEAHRAFCLSLGKPYTPQYWGVSASDSQHGYRAWGGPPEFGGVDGSVVPCAAAGSLPFVPRACLQVLQALRDTYGDRAYGRYGFTDAFHPQADWYNPDVLGIDIGIGVLMAENLRSGFVWQTFGRNPEVAVSMKKAGFTPA